MATLGRKVDIKFNIDKEELQKTVDKFNEMIETLKDTTEKLDGATKKATEAAKELGKMVDRASAERRRPVVRKP